MDNRVEAIWDELGANLKWFILKRVGNEQVAEDILQDVFIKIHTHLGSLQDDRKLQSWVYQITRNAIADYYRQPPQDLGLNDEFLQLDTSDEQMQAALNRSVIQMVDCLPEEYRTAVVLDTFEDLSQAEIGERLGISLSGAKSRVQRARAKLREILLECCHYEFDRRGNVIDYHPRRTAARSVAVPQIHPSCLGNSASFFQILRLYTCNQFVEDKNDNFDSRY